MSTVSGCLTVILLTSCYSTNSNSIRHCLRWVEPTKSHYIYIYGILEYKPCKLKSPEKNTCAYESLLNLIKTSESPTAGIKLVTSWLPVRCSNNLSHRLRWRCWRLQCVLVCSNMCTFASAVSTYMYLEFMNSTFIII